MIIKAILTCLAVLALAALAVAQEDGGAQPATDAPDLGLSESAVDAQGYDHQRFVRQMSGTETCLACHGSYNPVVRREDSSRHSLWVNSQLFLQSVHAKNGCHSCHTNIDDHGHRIAGSGAQRAEGCSPCHTEAELPAGIEMPESMFDVVEEENTDVTDAATGETVDERAVPDVVGEEGLAEPGEGLSEAGAAVLTAALRACIDCHEEEYNVYKDSVHGQSVLEHNNTDAPFCLDCHGIHYILSREDDRSKTYPANIPTTCLSCHDQSDIKARAGLTRSVGESFEESFHGKRGELGGASVAVCDTCHGYHGIYAPDDPRSRVNQRNLARTCGECHEGAQLNFATAFTHKTVTPTEQKGLYILKQIYKWVIFLLIAQFVLFAALDIFQMIRHKRAAKKNGGGHSEKKTSEAKE